MPDPISIATLLDLILSAQKKVPALKFALGVAAIAAAGAIVTAVLGEGKLSVIVLGGVLIAMVLLLVFSRLAVSRHSSLNIAGIVLLWSVIVFFCTFLFFTATAFSFSWPSQWANFLGVGDRPDFTEDVRRDLEVPDQIAKQFLEISSQPDAGIVRLQVPSADGLVNKQREAISTGGGTYYSFVQRTHEYGYGSDIAYTSGRFKTGFAGADYGFFLYLGSHTVEDFIKLEPEPPSWLPKDRIAAWNYMWNYRPPTDIKEIRLEQDKSRGFVVDGARFSETVAVAAGSLYLLRSINIDQSDILVAIYCVKTLSDRSIIILYRILKQFDTPVALGREN